MKNVVILQKLEDGDIYCQQINKKGIEYMTDHKEEEEVYWEEGGTILLDELDEILDREIEDA